VDVLSACLFDPKYIQVSVAEYLENMLVTNRGKNAVFSLVNSKLRIAMNTISAIVGIGLNNHGQPSGSGVINNRPKAINGWIEAMNANYAPGWEGSTFTNYGTQARNGAIGNVLNSDPVWAGNTDGTAGPITYSTLEEIYQTASRGNEQPDLFVANKALYAYVKERIQTQQIFHQERDPYYGADGFKINKAIALKDDYFPSFKYGVNDARIGTYLTGTFTSPAANADGGTSGNVSANSGMPAAVTIQVREVGAFFNMSKWLLRVVNNEEFGFGWTGFIRAQDGTRVAGQIKAMTNLQGLAPWSGVQFFGVNG